MTNIILGIPAHKPTSIYPTTYKIISELDEKYIKLITKWVFIHSGTRVEIPKYDGSLICYQGVRFNGSPEIVFWQDFINGYLNNEPIEVLRKVGELAQKTDQNIKECLYEAEKLLGVMGHRVFEQMSDTDQTLKGNGSKRGERKDVSSRVSNFKRYLSEHRKIIELEFSQNGKDITLNNGEIIEVKPNICGIGLNLNAVWKKYKIYDKIIDTLRSTDRLLKKLYKSKK
jgi:uncharacterized protein with von Willebrand factor type A (vWA) domain